MFVQIVYQIYKIKDYHLPYMDNNIAFISSFRYCLWQYVLTNIHNELLRFSIVYCWMYGY